MKLKDGYVASSVAGQQVIVAIGDSARTFPGMAQANKTASFLIERLQSEVSEDDLVAALLAEYEVDEERARRDVRSLIDKLRSIGAIE